MKPILHRILKSDLKLSMASARWVPRLFSVGIANTTQLVTIVNCPASLIIQMACAGGSDLLLIKLVHKLHYWIFSFKICMVMQK